MRIRLQRDIDRLKECVVQLATLVEERFAMAVKATVTRDVELAQKVVRGDIDIDQMEVDLEEECLKVLALHQPVADQLRYIVAVLKMNNDLERIGDLAVNIAQRIDSSTVSRDTAHLFDYFDMSRKVGEMLRNALDSLVNSDLDLAYQVCAADDEVDAMKNGFQAQFIRKVRQESEDPEQLINLFLVSRHLERIADHATNIAEDVIYMITGRIHRHRGDEFASEKTGGVAEEEA